MNKQQLFDRLGFSGEDRVAVIHMDDIGFCHSSNVATFECLDFGVASCGSTIVPAPWFFETAEICRNNPQYDVGVELALTCEYERCRWRGVSGGDSESGLLDHQGCLWKSREQAVENVRPEAAEVELRRQLEMAFDNGIDVTHLATHMGAARDEKFLPTCRTLAREFRVPLMERDMFDNVMSDMKLGRNEPYDPLAYVDYLAGIEPGLTYVVFHPAKMSAELQAFCGTAKWRNQSYEAFTHPRIKELLDEMDVKIIGYREIRDALRETGEL